MAPSLHVALVDDEDSRSVFLRCLQDAGYDVVEFDSGDSALTYVGRSPGPVVLFLGSLRYFNARIEQECLSGHLHLVLATGAPERSVPQVTGVTILRKPVDIGELLAAVVHAAATPCFQGEST
jgi:DNA-binding NtrC family response regulator